MHAYYFTQTVETGHLIFEQMLYQGIAQWAYI